MRFAIAVVVTAFVALSAGAAEPLTPLQQEMVKHLDTLRPELVEINQEIWTLAELGLEEHRSAARLAGVLKKAGFKVKEGVSNMPTAFVAEYGSGKPVIGILAEYDALPELSQEATGTRKPASGRTTNSTPIATTSPRRRSTSSAAACSLSDPRATSRRTSCASSRVSR